jgi:molybdopterin molybdotransferase
MMDGYAVRLADARGAVPVATEIPAGTTWDGVLVDGSCIAILTGAPCPAGTEAVVPKEHTRRQGSDVLLPAEITPGQNIAAVGSECREGQRILSAGTCLTPLGVAALASFGKESVRIVPRPSVAIITTGGELVSQGDVTQPGQICDSNGPMLVALAMELGLAAPRYLHAGDTMAELRQVLESSKDADIVVLSGGVSVGTYDLVPQALAEIGAETVFHGVKQKPGKPLLFARTARQLFFGLPGNPLSCHFGFHRYVSAAARKMSGLEGPPHILHGVLTAPYHAKGDRTHFVLARAEPALQSESAWRVAPLPAVSSADIFHAGLANCCLEAPPNRPLAAGDACRFTWLGNR